MLLPSARVSTLDMNEAKSSGPKLSIAIEPSTTSATNKAPPIGAL